MTTCGEVWRQRLCGNCSHAVQHRCTLPPGHGGEHVEETEEAGWVAAWWGEVA